MQWMFLFSAIILEVLGTTSMKLSKGFSRLFPSILMGTFYVSSLVMLNFAIKKLDISIAYAVWSGLGIALIAVAGLIFFGESLNVIKVLSILLIIMGIIGLNLSGTSH